MAQTIYFGHKNVNINFQPNIGLDASIRKAVIDMLTLLLADEVVLAYKIHKADGGTGKSGVSDLLSLYKTQYKQMNSFSSEITERIQILGGSHLPSFEELLVHTRLRIDLNSVPNILNILADHEAIIRFLREDAQKCSELYEDQGSLALLVNVLRSHEKMAWILRKNIDQEQIVHDA